MDALFESYSEIDQLDILKLGVINSTPLMLQYLKSKPKIQKQLDASMSHRDYMEICRHGTEESIKAFSNTDFTKLKDVEGNTCMHEASRYGNLNVLRYLSRQRHSNFNALNNNHETPLTYSLKNNLRHYEKVALLLADKTDLSIRDGNHKLPYEVPVDLDESRARVFEAIEDKYKKRFL